MKDRETTLEVVFRRTSDAHIVTLVGGFYDEAPSAAAAVAEEEELSSPASTSTTPPPQQQQGTTNNIGLRQFGPALCPYALLHHSF
jgi:hypothetical protein